MSNPDMGVNLDPTDKVFSLQILVAQVVQIQNSVDDIASPVGISSNMLIKAAITKISFFSIFSTIKHASNKRKVCFHGQRIRLDQVWKAVVSGSYGIKNGCLN